MHSNNVSDERLDILQKTTLAAIQQKRLEVLQKRRLKDLRKVRQEAIRRNFQPRDVSRKKATLKITAKTLIWILCILGSIKQSVDLFRLYLSYPTLFDLKMVKTNNTNLPAIAVCIPFDPQPDETV